MFRGYEKVAHVKLTNPYCLNYTGMVKTSKAYWIYGDKFSSADDL
jgi:hypothetical protein